MDRVDNYQEVIKDILNNYVSLENKSTHSDTVTHAIFDDERQQYMLFRVGWWREKRVRTAAIYIRLEDDKIWIEEDLTEDGVATDLLNAGVPKEHIVLAFHHPDIRPMTEFAIA